MVFGNHSNPNTCITGIVKQPPKFGQLMVIFEPVDYNYRVHRTLPVITKRKINGDDTRLKVRTINNRTYDVFVLPEFD